MRMWMVNPKMLCQKHLLGEHGEIHKHRHNFVKKHSIAGRVAPVVLIEPVSMQLRHDELAKEMLARGMNHQSPYELPDLSHLPDCQRSAKVDVALSKTELCKRCSNCEKLIHEQTSC
jgi:Pyrimidine dimer DNA glycosylase